MNQRGMFLLAVAFVASRLCLFALPPITSDVGIYARYVQEFDEAGREGVPFYELHGRNVDARTQKAREEGKLVGSLEGYKDVEYPPLALLFMRAPRLWLGSAAAGEEVSVESGFGVRYRASFMAIMAAVDVALFGLLIGLIWPRLTAEYAGSAEKEEKTTPLPPPRSPRTPRLILYFLSTILLWHLLYDRLDMALALLIVLALWLLSSRLHYFWSFAVLAVAVNFKVVPLVLAPVWVLGSMTGAEILSLPRPRGLLVLAARSCLLLLLIVGCFFPFYLVSGNPTLGFFTYHQDRGLEMGSVYSSLPLALHALGMPLAVEYSYGSINVRSALADELVKFAPGLTASVLLLATILLVVHCRRLASANGADATTRLAEQHPRIVAGYALVYLMLYILANKVFSPQYLLWLAPLLALAPFERRTWRWFFWGFLLLCLISTTLTPFLFIADLYDWGSETVPRAFKEPTVRVSVLLSGRNFLFLALTAAVIARLFTPPRRQTAPTPEGAL